MWLCIKVSQVKHFLTVTFIIGMIYLNLYRLLSVDNDRNGAVPYEEKV